MYKVKEIREVLSAAVQRLRRKLEVIDIYSLDIHAYSLYYLKKYLANPDFEIGLNAEILAHGIVRSGKSPSQLAVLDFGGGMGLMSLLACESGFKRVLYYDSDGVISTDFKTLSKLFENFDIEFVSSKSQREYSECIQRVDLLVSRDVIEHIYDPGVLFSAWGESSQLSTMVHATSANMYNIWLRKHFKSVHEIAEKKGFMSGLNKSNYIPEPYFVKRRQILSDLLNADPDMLDVLAAQSRGLDRRAIEEWVRGGLCPREPERSNTCDPDTGNWAERLLPFSTYRDFGRNNGFHFDTRGGALDVKGGWMSRMGRMALNQLIRCRCVGPMFWPYVNLIYTRSLR